MNLIQYQQTLTKQIKLYEKIIREKQKQSDKTEDENQQQYLDDSIKYTSGRVDGLIYALTQSAWLNKKLKTINQED